MRMKTCFALIIVMVNVSYSSNPACLWKGPNGLTYDLNRLTSSKNYRVGDEGGEGTVDGGMFSMVYEFNFCQPVTCNDRNVVGMEALEVMGTVTDNCDALGLAETQKVQLIDPNKPDIGIRVHYSGGDQCFQMKGHPQIQNLGDQDMEMVPRSITFDINCASYDSNQFRLTDNSSCEMKFQLEHTLGCGNTKGNTSSTFVLLILLGGFGAYMLIGMQMNQRKHGTSSMESLPHLEFWRDFPFLVKDGINYSLLTLFNLIRQVQGKEQRQQYSTV